MGLHEQQQLIEALDRVDASDPEAAHAEADELLLDYVREDVRAAYERIKERARWWAAA